MADELTPIERGMLDAWRPMHPPAGFPDTVVTARNVRRRLAVAAVAACAVACAGLVLAVARPRESEPEPVVVVVTTPPDAVGTPHDAGSPAIEPVRILDAAIQPAPVTVDSADVLVPAGETATIHDPKGNVLVRFAFAALCGERGTVDVDTNSRFTKPIHGSDKGFADIRLAAGTWSYRVRCGDATSPSASGRLSVRKDNADRPLPKSLPVNPIAADGRSYRISYESVIPDVAFEVDTVPTALHLSTKGHEEVIITKDKRYVVPGNRLAEATYSFWTDGQTNKSTLIIVFDQTAPQIHIDAPAKGAAWPDPVEIRGAALPGWQLVVDGVNVPISRGRFIAHAPRPEHTLALRFLHPQRGIHYYLRRR